MKSISPFGAQLIKLITITLLPLVLFSCGKYKSDLAASSASAWELESNLFYAEAGIFADEGTKPPPPTRETAPLAPGSSPSGGYQTGGGTSPGTSPVNSEVCTSGKVATEMQRVQSATDYFTTVDPAIISPEQKACIVDRLNMAAALLQELQSRLATSSPTESCRSLMKGLIAELGITRPASCP